MPAWTDGTFNGNGSSGSSGTTGTSWTAASNTGCNTSLALLCIEQ